MKSKILLVLNLLFGLMFINARLNKFLNYMPPPDDLPRKSGESDDSLYGNRLVDAAYCSGRNCRWSACITHRYRTLGAIIIFPILMGIVLFHITTAPKGLPIALALLAINLWVIY